MSATFFIGILIVGMFAASYFTKRRFGLLGLGLAAGALVSQYGGETLTPFVAGQGLTVTQPQVEILITLLPALLLLFGGPTYGKMHMRLLGSALFALLALALVLGSLESYIRYGDPLMPLFETVGQYQGVIIVVTLLIAVVDVFLGRSSGTHRSKKTPH